MGAAAAGRRGGAAMIRFDDEVRTVSYRELHEEVLARAPALWGVGVRPGVHVGDLHESLVKIQQQRILWRRGFIAQPAQASLQHLNRSSRHASSLVTKIRTYLNTTALN